jgi:hypothetical protein
VTKAAAGPLDGIGPAAGPLDGIGPAAGPLDGIGPAARGCMVAVVAPDSPPPPLRAFADEADLIVAEGLAAVAVHALRKLPEYRDDPHVGMFRSVALTTQMKAMAADVGAVATMVELARRGLNAVVVKGPAMSRLHPDGWPRTYGDIDLVVTPGQFAATVECAEDLGFIQSTRAVPQWPWFNSLCREGINLHSSTGGNLDVHHHIPPWSIGRAVKVEGILQRGEPAELCGTPVRFAVPEDLLLVSALHILNDLWKGKAGLASWRDVLILMTRLGPEQARSAFAGARLAWLHDLVIDEFARSVPESAVMRSRVIARPHGRTALRLSALGWSGDSVASRLRMSWATRLPVANGMAFLAGSLIPSPSYIKDRHGSYVDYWRRGLAETVATTKGSDYRMTSLDDNG